MNWLGKLVTRHVADGDEVLDLGCGIMPATGGRMVWAKRHVGVDCFLPYLELIGPPVVHGALPGVAEQFGDGSFDVVLLLDVIEHLDKPDALVTICHAERIARREVVLFTPDGFVPQEGFESWGMPYNPDQAHRCGFTFDELTALGYECKRYQNGSKQAGAFMAVLGVKCLTPR